MSAQLAYGIDSWYPVVRGGMAPTRFYDAADGSARTRLRKTWAAMQDGERVVLQGCANPGSKPALEPLEEVMASAGHVERFLVLPGTGGSFTLLPMKDGAALRGGLPLLPSGRRRGRALWAALRLVRPTTLLQRLGQPQIAIWTKGPASRAEQDLPVLPVEGSIAVAAGVPGRNQKVIVRALDRRGHGRVMLKIGFSERSDDAVAREAQALRCMALSGGDQAPRLVAEGERAGRTWLAQEVLHGRHAGDVLTPAHADFLIRLGAMERTELALAEVPAYRDAVQHLTNLAPAFDEDWHAQYSRLRTAIESSLEGAAVPTCRTHGDFTPWNTVIKGGVVQAFDWEYFSEAQPALYDAVHFHLQSSILVGQLPAARIFDGLDAFFRGPVKELVRASGLDRDQILRAVALYILHEGTAAEVQERLRPAPFAQAAWLRRARLELCSRLAGLLLERQLPDWARAGDAASEGGRAAA